jgi:hypothetical protein
MQSRFAAAYVRNGGDATAAAIEAGYSERSAADLGRRAFETPYVQECILREMTLHRARAGAVGLSTLVKIAESEKASAPARVAAGRALLEFAGVAEAARGGEGAPWRSGDAAPDYKAILDTFANISALAVAAKTEAIQ